MRIATVLLAASFSMAAQAQSDIWKQVNPAYTPTQQLQLVTPSDAQLRSVAKLIHQSGGDSYICAEDGLSNEITERLIFEKIPVTHGQQVLLILVDGSPHTRGCSAKWLVRFDGEMPVLLASPDKDFNGNLYSIQPSARHGYNDLVLSWHQTVTENDLIYFRFDGKSYVSIGSAREILDKSGKLTIVPDAR